MVVFSAHVKTPGLVVPLIVLGKWKLFDGLPIMNDLFEVRITFIILETSSPFTLQKNCEI